MKYQHWKWTNCMCAHGEFSFQLSLFKSLCMLYIGSLCLTEYIELEFICWPFLGLHTVTNSYLGGIRFYREIDDNGILFWCVVFTSPLLIPYAHCSCRSGWFRVRSACSAVVPLVPQSFRSFNVLVMSLINPVSINPVLIYSVLIYLTLSSF